MGDAIARISYPAPSPREGWGRTSAVATRGDNSYRNNPDFRKNCRMTVSIGMSVEVGT